MPLPIFASPVPARNRFGRLTSRCFVNAPFAMLQEDLLALVLDHRLQPEVGLEGEVLYDCHLRDFERIATTLKDAGLACTLHAPFLDLAPGATDSRIRRMTREKLRRAFELIPIFSPRAIVCHLGYEDNKHGHVREEWFRHSLETWQELLPLASSHGTVLTLENTFEAGPETHRPLLTALASPHARFCLDMGHVQAFARNTWQDWLPTLAPWLGQLHLHDNRGDRDAHLPIGTGTVDFTGLFEYLRKNGLNPLVTLEPHTREGLWQSLDAIERLRLLEFP